jgi:cytidylate kinase
MKKRKTREKIYMEHIVIGIEGLVGAGKTSICRELIKKIPNTVLLNGGNLYRAIVYAMMKSGANLEQLKHEANNIDIKTMMDLFKIELKFENNETKIYMDGVLLEEEKLQSEKASMAVSEVGGIANNEALFTFARNLIDTLKIEHNIIISGRSIMQIYPKTNYHFFVTASIEERVRRKSIQYNGEVNLKELEEHIAKRDELQEKAGFYKLSSNTICVDVTNCKTVEESANKVLEHIKLA